MHTYPYLLIWLVTTTVTAVAPFIRVVPFSLSFAPLALVRALSALSCGALAWALTLLLGFARTLAVPTIGAVVVRVIGSAVTALADGCRLRSGDKLHRSSKSGLLDVKWRK